MADAIEREVKLRFATAAEARAAVLGAGATALRERRLQRDCLLDTADSTLRQRRCALRIRTEPSGSFITFKGPPQVSAVKAREEIETVVGNAEVLLRLFEQLGFRPWFRYEKYRSEFSFGGCVLAIDETPVGTFVEIEGGESEIADAARALGRSAGDYLLQSYYLLYRDDCERRGAAVTDMLFA
jgi:adenylate cyclase, class 2